MIKEFTCSNFRNVEVDHLKFSRINLLIGPNNAGKSNFIRALSFSANMINGVGADTSGFLAEVRRNGSYEILNHTSEYKEVNLKWEIALKRQEVDYSLRFHLDKNESECYIEKESLDSAMPLRGYEQPFNFFRFHDEKPGYGMFSTAHQRGRQNSRVHVKASRTETGLLQFDKLLIQNQDLLKASYIRNTTFTMLEEMKQYFSRFFSYSSSKFDYEKIRQLQTPGGKGGFLEKDGSNFLNVYQQACDIDPDFEERFFKKMKSLILDLEKIEVVEGLDKIGMRLQMDKSKYMISEVSDGTIEALILALLTSMPKEQAPSLLAIDEPEVNLHPAWQSVLAKWLQLSGNFTQCFISTHSSDFLDSFTEGFADNHVSIFVYDPIGKYTFKELDRDRVNREIEKGWMLGDLYRVNDPAIGGWPW